MPVPLVSVIVPAYNRRALAVEAVRSVLAQTFQDLEVVAVDDGSEDGTAEALEAVADPRVRVVRKEHSGIAATRNRGVAEARGRVLAFLDSDDLWVEGKLERQLPLLEAGAGFVYARYRAERDGKVLRSKPVGGPSGDIFLALLRRIFLQMSTAVVRREAAEAAGPFDESYAYADEYDWFLRLAERFPAGFVDEDLVIYRVHDDNESRRTKVRIAENLEVYRRLSRREDLPRRTRRIAARRVARYAFQLGDLLRGEGDREGAARAYGEAREARPLWSWARAAFGRVPKRMEGP